MTSPLLPVVDAYSLLSPDAAPRLDAARLAHQARSFFSAVVAVPERSIAERDRIEVEISEGASVHRVEIVTAPIEDAAEIVAAADEAVRAIGGAGMDALVARARRVWQVRGAGTDRAPLLLAAVLASLLLAPIVPPGGGAIFGVRGARERLARI